MADGYEITNTAPKVRSEPGGRFVQTVEVTFTTKPSHQVGIVDIPAVDFTPDSVDRVVSALARNIEAVKAL